MSENSCGDRVLWSVLTLLIASVIAAMSAKPYMQELRGLRSAVVRLDRQTKAQARALDEQRTLNAKCMNGRSQEMKAHATGLNWARSTAGSFATLTNNTAPPLRKRYTPQRAEELRKKFWARRQKRLPSRTVTRPPSHGTVTAFTREAQRTAT